jgi:hypothetical protein
MIRLPEDKPVDRETPCPNSQGLDTKRSSSSLKLRTPDMDENLQKGPSTHHSAPIHYTQTDSPPPPFLLPIKTEPPSFVKNQPPFNYTPTSYDPDHDHMDDESWIRYRQTCFLGFFATTALQKEAITEELRKRGRPMPISDKDMKELKSMHKFKNGLRGRAASQWGPPNNNSFDYCIHLGTKYVSIIRTDPPNPPNQKMTERRKDLLASQGKLNLS